MSKVTKKMINSSCQSLYLVNKLLNLFNKLNIQAIKLYINNQKASQVIWQIILQKK